MSRKELLVHGFIRNIQKVLGQTKLIPLDVIEICSVFYSMQIDLFYLSKNSSNIYVSNGACIHNLSLNLGNNDKSQRLKSGCYIPDISSFINIKDTSLNTKKRYDGIITESNTWNLTLFESHTKCNEIIECNTFSSNQNIETRTLSSLYCDEIDSVVYCGRYKIAQLRLRDINVATKQFNFTLLSTSIDASEDGCIGYIYGANKLFVIHKEIDVEEFFGHLLDRRLISDTVQYKCGIFDFDENKLISTKPFTYMYNNRQYGIARSGVCKNNKYDSNIVYVVSKFGNTAKFDINQDEWITITTDLFQASGNKPIVWMNDNPFIIYSSDFEYYRYLDVRDNKPKWTENNEMYETVNQLNDSAEMFFL